MEALQSNTARRNVGLRWFAVRTQPHKEMTASTRLTAQGFEVFLPLIERTLRHARKITVAKRAFFPRYLFVRFDPDTAQWRSINGTIGVDRLIMGGERPQPIKHAVVETLLASVDENQLLQFRDPLKVGDPVRLLNGPFANELGVLDEMRSSDRVRILLSLLDQTVPVVVERRQIAAMN